MSDKYPSPVRLAVEANYPIQPHGLRTPTTLELINRDMARDAARWNAGFVARTQVGVPVSARFFLHPTLNQAHHAPERPWGTIVSSQA
jgi:hypothetical protein